MNLKELFVKVFNRIGSRENLVTLDKSNLVSAINEIKTRFNFVNSKKVFENYIIFDTVGIHNWPIPAGVKKIFIEMSGAGGAGSDGILYEVAPTTSGNISSIGGFGIVTTRFNYNNNNRIFFGAGGGSGIIRQGVLDVSTITSLQFNVGAGGLARVYPDVNPFLIGNSGQETTLVSVPALYSESAEGGEGGRKSTSNSLDYNAAAAPGLYSADDNILVISSLLSVKKGERGHFGGGVSYGQVYPIDAKPAPTIPNPLKTVYDIYPNSGHGGGEQKGVKSSGISETSAYMSMHGKHGAGGAGGTDIGLANGSTTFYAGNGGHGYVKIWY